MSAMTFAGGHVLPIRMSNAVFMSACSRSAGEMPRVLVPEITHGPVSAAAGQTLTLALMVPLVAHETAVAAKIPSGVAFPRSTYTNGAVTITVAKPAMPLLVACTVLL